jgi:hypothetical protein
MSKDLLKEAIADAKAVRSTAIANARLALEEAFTPKLQSMLSQKIAEEMDDEVTEDEELDTTDTSVEDDEAAVADTTADAADTGSADDETNETGEDMPAEESYEEGEEVDEIEEADDAELEEIIRELEGEEEVTETEEEEVTESEEEAPVEESSDEDETVAESEEEVEESEELDLDEIIKSLQEEDETVEEEEEVEENKEAELDEAYKTIRFLKSKINEVNLLNSKLLYSNKLFRARNLNESQKMKVIETFDRANSVREVKLVYSTLAESLTAYTPKKKVNESFASRAQGSTRPSKDVIVESNTFANRMQRLAGLK